MPVDDDTRSKLLGIWEALGSPDPPDLPMEALISEGISQDDYNTWRLDLEDEKRQERKILADAKRAEARDAELRAQGMEPMPPRRTREEVEAIGRSQRERDERARRHQELTGKAEWLPDDEDD